MESDRERICADIRNADFDGFVAFLFEPSVPSGESFCEACNNRRWRRWDYDTKVTFNADRVCDHYIQLFREPGFLLERFSTAQLEQGFWAIQGPTLECSAYSLIWNPDLHFAKREACVRAMYFLFRDLFAFEALENAVCMWWDSFCYGWHCGNRKRERGGEEMATQDVMFETLAQILALPSEICHGAALHGLSHLHHPATADLIQKFLEQHPTLSDEWRHAALGAARFELM
jgi:hypothetical protein